MTVTSGALNANGVTAGLYMEEGHRTLDVSGGTVTATSNTGTGIYMFNDISSYRAYMYVKGGTVTATGNGNGVEVNGWIDVSNGTLNATAAENGIYTEYLEVNDGEVNATATGKVDGTTISGTGIKGSLLIDGGELNVKCSPENAGEYTENHCRGIDAIERSGSIEFKGGTSTIYGSEHAAITKKDYGNIYKGTNVTITGSSNNNLELGSERWHLEQDGTDPVIITDGKVKPKLRVTGTATVNDKIYDGTTAATLNTDDMTLSGVAEGDTVMLEITNATASFTDKNVGTDKTVTANATFTLTGANADKYRLQ